MGLKNVILKSNAEWSRQLKKVFDEYPDKRMNITSNRCGHGCTISMDINRVYDHYSSCDDTSQDLCLN